MARLCDGLLCTSWRKLLPPGGERDAVIRGLPNHRFRCSRERLIQLLETRIRLSGDAR